MSDAEETDQPFAVDKAKTGRAACKKCKEKCAAGELRMARVAASPFGSGKMHNWFHIDCLLATFKTQRATSKSITSVDDISGWSVLGDLDRETILEKLETVDAFRKGDKSTDNTHPTAVGGGSGEGAGDGVALTDPHYRPGSDDNLFREFRRICERLAGESSYLGKTSILHNFFLKGSNGQRFEGKLYVWTKLLLPNAEKRIYNLQSRQLIKLFSRIFGADQADMLADLEQGDVSETIRKFFERCQKRTGSSNASTLTLDDVDEYLHKLSLLSKEDEQVEFFRVLCRSCTPDDLQMIIRFIKHDLRINAGAKHVLAALSANAYVAYQSSRDLRAVVQRFAGGIATNRIDVVEGRKAKADGDGIQLMSPISPMLAEACKSVERAIEKCPDGMYSEIKYDGERIQLHKRGGEFRFFSRSLKPVPDHKTKRCEQFIPQAFPGASDLILDTEILMVDTQTGEQLPFGTLGKHKKTAFDTAEVCLFVFDCIYYNGEDLTKKPLKERRQILEQHITPIRNHVQLSEYHLIRKPRELSVMIAKVLQMGLEGLVLKNVNGAYEPGKRHWLKVKKDYLFDGQMADAADLVVLGAWFGTGKKGGMLSVYLMGSWDDRRQRWCTVTKVHTGLDDRTMDRVHKELTARTVRANADAPPAWLHCKRPLVPDVIARDPLAMPVWEITGAEFTKSDHHTADGISIRFPRITRQRDDKTPSEATNLADLHRLYEASKECTNLQLLTDDLTEADDTIHIQTKVQKTSPKPATTSGGGGGVKRRSGDVDEANAVSDNAAADKKRAKLLVTEQAVCGEQSSARVSADNTLAGGSGRSRSTRSRVAVDATGSLQQKLKYKYRDSSSDDGSVAEDDRDDVDDDTTIITTTNTARTATIAAGADNRKETRARIPDMFTATAAGVAAKTIARARRGDVGVVGVASGADAGRTSQLVDRQIVSDFVNAAPTTTTSAAATAPVEQHRCADNEVATPTENNRITLSTAAAGDVGPAARKSTINIFEGVVLLVPDGAAGDDVADDAVRDVIKEELRYFQLWGGRVVLAGTDDGASMECTHALHRGTSVRYEHWLAVLRHRYAPHCRHVQLGWLVDAVRTKQRVSDEAYPVTLRI